MAGKRPWLIFILFIYQINKIKAFTDCKKLTPEVEIHSGKVVGQILNAAETDKEYSAFKGIKYGNILARFLPPIDVEPWSHVASALNHGPICLQCTLLGRPRGSEDCLYLNVYTPLTDFNFTEATHPKKTVMVWIHGGAFTFGSGNSEQYGPDFIVSNDVILVTFNYRLGALGFLNLQHPSVPGNAGMKDQILALTWVKRNIAKFGGDPDSVTIFGQSAGGVSVDLHLLSKMSKGLFKRSIALSGSVFCPWAFTHNPIYKARRIADMLFSHTQNLNTEDLIQQFLTAPASTLVKHNFLLVAAYKELVYIPSIENSTSSTYEAFIDGCFDKYFTQSRINQGDHVLGYTSLEINIDFLSWFDRLHRLSRTASDISFDTPIDLKQRYLSKYASNMTVYYYNFGYTPKHDNKANHNDDLPYLFFDRNYYKQFKKEDLQVKNKFVGVMTNFAKYGNPSINEMSPQVEWTPSDQTGNYLKIDQYGNFRMIKGRPTSTRKLEDFKKKNLCVNYKPQLFDFFKYIFV